MEHRKHRKLSDVILIYHVSKRPGSFRNRSKGGSTIRLKNLTNKTGNRVTDVLWILFSFTVVFFFSVSNIESILIFWSRREQETSRKVYTNNKILRKFIESLQFQWPGLTIIIKRACIVHRLIVLTIYVTRICTKILTIDNYFFLFFTFRKSLLYSFDVVLKT